MVVAPSFFGNVELGSIPAQEPEQLIGRVVEATLFDITADFSHHFLKMFFQVNEIDQKTAKTCLKGMNIQEIIFAAWLEEEQQKLIP